MLVPNVEQVVMRETNAIFLLNRLVETVECACKAINLMAKFEA